MMNEDGTWPIEDLEFAATARCRCGAGLAYPDVAEEKGSKVQASAWICSDWLTGIVNESEGCADRTGGMFGTNEATQALLAKTKHDAYPFFCYDVKSDGQPSANGRTTRREDQMIRDHTFTLDGTDDPKMRGGTRDNSASSRDWRTRYGICGACGIIRNAHREPEPEAPTFDGGEFEDQPDGAVDVF